MRRPLVFIVLLGVALALIVSIVRDDQGTLTSLSGDDAGHVVYYGALLLLIGSSVMTMFANRPSRTLEAVMFWLVVGFVLIFAYSYRTELRVAADRVLNELMPGRASPRGERTVEIVRGRGGDYQVAAQINGNRVAMVLDTGASSVVLTQDAAKAAGLPLDVLSYTIPVDTANGRTRAAAVTIDRLAVGNIVERSVPALVAQPGQLRTNLLGMSFLNRLESWEVRGDKLMMRGYP